MNDCQMQNLSICYQYIYKKIQESFRVRCSSIQIVLIQIYMKHNISLITVHLKILNTYNSYTLSKDIFNYSHSISFNTSLLDMISLVIMIVLFIKNITYNNHLFNLPNSIFSQDQQEQEKHLFINSYLFQYQLLKWFLHYKMQAIELF